MNGIQKANIIDVFYKYTLQNILNYYGVLMVKDTKKQRKIDGNENENNKLLKHKYEEMNELIKEVYNVEEIMKDEKGTFWVRMWIYLD